MPSANDLVIESHELPPPKPREETNCVVCQNSLRYSEEKELLVLACGHAQHRSCVEEWLTGPREHQYPEYAEHVEIDQAVEVIQPLANVEPVLDKIDLARPCPVCRHVILPAEQQGYNFSQYEDGIAPEEAQHMLNYFADAKHGEQRMARLNDNATIGIELQTAHDRARRIYTGEFWTIQEAKETEDCFARADRLMEQRDAADSDYEPPKRKKVRRSRSRPEKTNRTHQHPPSAFQHQRNQKPAPVYIDLTLDSDDGDVVMNDADTPHAATKPSIKPSIKPSTKTSTKLSVTIHARSNGEPLHKQHLKTKVPNYLNGRRTDPLTVWRGPRSRDWLRSHLQRSMLRRRLKMAG